MPGLASATALPEALPADPVDLTVPTEVPADPVVRMEVPAARP